MNRDTFYAKPLGVFLEYLPWETVIALLPQVRRNPIEDGTISGFSGQKSVLE